MPPDSLELFLLRGLVIFLLVFAPLGAVVSLLLIVKPQLVERLNRIANHWISTRSLNRLLDRSISIEYWCYRHHRALGAVVMLGSVYIFVFFGILFDKPYAMRHVGWKLPDSLIDGLMDALVLTSLTGSVVAFLVGLFLFLRPSLLRGIEEEANQWVSTRRAIKMLDVPHDQVEKFVVRHTQRVGWLLLIGSICMFFIVFRLFV